MNWIALTFDSWPEPDISVDFPSGEIVARDPSHPIIHVVGAVGESPVGNLLAPDKITTLEVSSESTIVLDTGSIDESFVVTPPPPSYKDALIMQLPIYSDKSSQKTVVSPIGSLFCQNVTIRRKKGNQSMQVGLSLEPNPLLMPLRHVKLFLENLSRVGGLCYGCFRALGRFTMHLESFFL